MGRGPSPNRNHALGCPVVRFDIGARDSARLASFYKSLFGWNLSSFGPTQMVDTCSNDGIVGHISQFGHEPHHDCVVDMRVEDLGEHIKKAEGLGAACIIGPTEVPGMGHFSWLKDPEGHFFGLWKPMAS